VDIACVGGGPGGLLFAILTKLAGPAVHLTVMERNGPDDTFGFGVVFSDETLANLRSADPVTFDRIESEMRYWPDIEVQVRGRILVSGGHGFAALSRKRLLAILAERAAAVGVDVRFRTAVTAAADLERLRQTHDLLVGSDGVNSSVRQTWRDHFDPSVELGRSKYIWFGTDRPLDRFTFIIAETPCGVVQAHAYPYSDTMSTLIAETDEGTWRRLGFEDGAAGPTAPGESDPRALAFAQDLFADHLEGHRIVPNNSRWLSFPTVRNHRWHFDNVVILGDAAHTAHFSIGSGTKLAMEDAIALAGAVAPALSGTIDLDAALAGYQQDRKPVVESTQRAAVTSQAWFEGISRYVDLGPEQFTFQLLTRSQRITDGNLRRRDPEFRRHILNAFWKNTRLHLRPADPATPPMFYPFQIGELRLANRIVVSPMAQYSAVEGLPTDWHLVHLGSRAVGGAGLVMTEMTCVSPEGRITPGCTGLWNEQQRDAWSRIVGFVHQHTPARIGLQLGHSGRKGSCTVPWEGADDEPLASGGWPVMAPSPLPYRPDGPLPQPMTRADMDQVRDQFVLAARLGAEAGFDLLELHFAHGYLLSSFISPLTNHRRDRWGGDLQGRMRYPLEVLEAVRAAWPADRPISVRISATDWAEGGIDGDDAVAMARLLVGGGCDIIDVSTGQVDQSAQPRYGRLYQTPFSDRIRHEAGCPTMTVGAVSSVDDVNTIILSGRADLCLLARPHLVDPYWTLNAAMDQGYADHPWPPQYLPARTARRREQQAVAPPPGSGG
jgi:anthraniloyl-CoA monooxygenase